MNHPADLNSLAAAFIVNVKRKEYKTVTVLIGGREIKERTGFQPEIYLFCVNFLHIYAVYVSVHM